MIKHTEIAADDLRSRIRQQTIKLGGNESLKIYGTLNCRSGKKLKKSNRVFFESEKEAIEHGYRPCGHCLKSSYQFWKKNHYKVGNNLLKHDNYERSP